MKLSVKQERVIATEVIRTGSVIRENQVRLETHDGPPGESRISASLEEVVGRVAKTSIVAGAPIRNNDVAVAPEIQRGDLVSVEVLNGAARISLEALAATTARLGDSVELKNQASGKTFRAKVSGMGRAVIVLGRTN